ncbi:unnamed protein product [Allacma fusca]|uniref:Calx-beta domain-containing protein n=1 Tax=Allacma fusca TaxID=39272 RepID=A0A8J2KAL0_9HEXA|nr:unnamed protein product [Allacma fusca]
MPDELGNITIPILNQCHPGLLLPIIPFENSWSREARAVLYFAGLLYCFMGVAIVANVFMGSIEKITSKTRKIYLSTGKDSEPEVLEVRIWNDTVANLTLMALGSSAPEILLSVIEIVGNGFKAGDLGPGTIVGSAAFNLLAISAVCVIAIPNGEGRSIRLINVFLITSVFSLFAYIWLLIVLIFVTPSRVDSWEAILTFLFFPLLVLIAWWADRGWKCGKRVHTAEDQQIELGITNGSPGGECEQMLAHKKLFNEDGTLNKEGLIEFYKELRKYPDLTDADAATLAATKLIDNQHHSRLWYRIGACRDLTGSRKIHPNLSDKLQEVYDAINAHPDVPDIGPVPSVVADHTHEKAIVEFHSASFAVPENIGKFNVTVVRHGRMDNTVRVRVESFDGTAKHGSDYIPVNEVLVFGPYAKEREFAVKIIDDNQWEPDEEFFLRLTIMDEGNFERKDATIGRLPIMEVVILNDDEPGTLSFRKRGLLVKESCGVANLEVERANGADGEIAVKWRTIDGSAKSPADFQGGEGTLVFKHGEILRSIDIPIVDDVAPEKDECFEVELFEPSGGARLGRVTKVAVTISNDDDFNSVLQRMMVLTNQNIRSMAVHQESWKNQIYDAVTVNGGDVAGATGMDYIMHILTFGWKVLFSLIPPPGLLGGWLCFVSSLGAIGILTAVVGDLASIFGCLVGLKDTVTAITFVALGTSLPDLFASKAAASQEKYADNAIGNVTGSNSVNVFLGLGLPWMLAAIYWESQGEVFAVDPGSLGFSVLIYSIVAFITLGLILARRFLTVFGKSELGGPTGSKWATGIFMVFLWFVYIILSSLQAYGYIDIQLIIYESTQFIIDKMMSIRVLVVLGALISLSSAGVLSGLHAPAVLSAGLPLLQAPSGPAHVVGPLNVALPANPLVLSSPAQVPIGAISSVVSSPVLLSAGPALVAAPAVAYGAAPAVAYGAAPSINYVNNPVYGDSIIG